MLTLQAVREQVKAAIDEGSYELALDLIRRIRRSFPDDYETVGLLGRVYLECNRWDEARELYQCLLGVDPENLLARSSLAIISEEEGDLEDALDQFTRIFEIDISNRQVAAEIRRLNSRLAGPRRPDPGYSKHALARRLLREGMYKESIPLFEAALETAPEPALVALGMARALWLSGSLEEASGVADEILSSHPACLKALVIRAGAAYATGDPEAALLLEQSARLNPGNVVAKGIFEELEMAVPPVGLEADLPDEADSPDDSAEQEEAFTGEEENELREVFDLPEAEAEGEWVREKLFVKETTPANQQSRQQLAVAWDYFDRGLFEPAVEELRAALRLDGALLPDVREAALAMVEIAPENDAVRWLVGDVLVLDGQLRRAMEQYMLVLTDPLKRNQ